MTLSSILTAVVDDDARWQGSIQKSDKISNFY